MLKEKANIFFKILRDRTLTSHYIETLEYFWDLTLHPKSAGYIPLDWSKIS